MSLGLQCALGSWLVTSPTQHAGDVNHGCVFVRSRCFTKKFILTVHLLGFLLVRIRLVVVDGFQVLLGSGMTSGLAHVIAFSQLVLLANCL